MSADRTPILYLAPWVDLGGSDKGTIDWFKRLDRVPLGALADHDAAVEQPLVAQGRALRRGGLGRCPT